MTTKIPARVAMVAVLFAVFTLGYVCGSANLPRASAQMPQLPGGLPGGGTSGGTLASVTQLGSSIKEMEQHVTGLQKNLDDFKKIQSTLMGK
jgi:hypothetical protein